MFLLKFIYELSVRRYDKTLLNHGLKRKSSAWEATHAAETVSAAILLGATAGSIETAVRACSDLPIYRVADMGEAVKTADKIAKNGDIVFMSPASASFDMYKNFEERGDHFKQLVNSL